MAGSKTQPHAMHADIHAPNEQSNSTTPSLRSPLRKLSWHLRFSHLLVALSTLAVVAVLGLVMVQRYDTLAIPSLGRDALLVLGAASLSAVLLALFTASWQVRSLRRAIAHLSQLAQLWRQGKFADTSEELDALHDVALQLQDMARALQPLNQTHQDLYILEERNRAARNIQDSVKQKLFSLGVQLGSIDVALDDNVREARKLLNEAASLVQEAQQELNQSIVDLRPLSLNGKRLQIALPEQSKKWSQRTGIAIDLDLADTDTLPMAIEEALFRISQEALANVARHSQAAQVRLQLRYNTQHVTLTVYDDGVGFDSSEFKPYGLGLEAMRERLRSYQGTLSIQSKPREGTTLTASIPLENAP